MRRLPIALAAALTLALAAPAAQAATSAPAAGKAISAHRVSSTELCTLDTRDKCARDANDSDATDNPIVNGNYCSGGCSAQNMYSVDTGQRFEGLPLWNLKFTSHSSHCWGVSDSGHMVETRSCSAFGTGWVYDASGHMVNRGETNNHTTNWELTSDEGNGTQFTVASSSSTLTQVFLMQCLNCMTARG